MLKTFLKTDYRGITAFLKDCPDLCKAIRRDKVPHFTSLQKVGHKLLRLPIANRLLLETVQSVQKRRIALAAIDSTGLEAGHTSRYFVERKRSKQLENVETP